MLDTTVTVAGCAHVKTFSTGSYDLQYRQPGRAGAQPLRCGVWVQSVLYFQRALKLDKRCLSAWTLMGHEYLELKNPPAAIGAPLPSLTCPRNAFNHPQSCRGCWQHRARCGWALGGTPRITPTAFTVVAVAFSIPGLHTGKGGRSSPWHGHATVSLCSGKDSHLVMRWGLLGGAKLRAAGSCNHNKAVAAPAHKPTT